MNRIQYSAMSRGITLERFCTWCDSSQPRPVSDLTVSFLGWWIGTSKWIPRTLENFLGLVNWYFKWIPRTLENWCGVGKRCGTILTFVRLDSLIWQVLRTVYVGKEVSSASSASSAWTVGVGFNAGQGMWMDAQVEGLSSAYFISASYHYNQKPF